MDKDIIILQAIDHLYILITGKSLFFPVVNMAGKTTINQREYIKAPKPVVKTDQTEKYRIEVPLRPGQITDVSLTTGIESPMVHVTLVSEIIDCKAKVMSIVGSTINIACVCKQDTISGMGILHIRVDTFKK